MIKTTERLTTMHIYNDGTENGMNTIFKGANPDYRSANAIIRGTLLREHKNGAENIKFNLRSFSTLSKARGKTGRHLSISSHVFTSGLSIGLICKYALEFDQKVTFEFEELSGLKIDFDPSLSKYEPYRVGLPLKLLKIYGDNEAPAGGTVSLFNCYEDLIHSMNPISYIQERVDEILSEYKENSITFYANLPIINTVGFEKDIVNYTNYTIAYIINECMKKGIHISTHHKKEGETFPWTPAVSFNNLYYPN